LSLRNVQLRRDIQGVKKKKQEIEKNFSLSDINESRREIGIRVTRSILWNNGLSMRQKEREREREREKDMFQSWK